MFDFFKKEKNPRTMLDAVQETGNKLIVKGYRRIAAQYGCAPTSKTTDHKMIEIYSLVSKAFQQIAERRNEPLTAGFQNYIVLKFFTVYENFGERHMREHLEYETGKYLAEGLRPDYRRTLELFDPRSSDPDVKQLIALMRTTGQQIGQLISEPTQSIALPYPKLAATILNSSVAVAGSVLDSTQRITSTKLMDSVSTSLLDEVVSYHSARAINWIMATNQWHGKDFYDAIETGIFKEMASILLDMPNVEMKHLSLASPQSKTRARMYFLSDGAALDISEDQALAFAKQHNQEKAISITPPEQMHLPYYLIRISRVIQVNKGIDQVVMHYCTQMLIDGFEQLEKDVSTIIRSD